MIPFNFLLIDDEPEYCDTLSLTARHHNIQIHAVHNLEAGRKELEIPAKYHAIILDAKCLINSEQEVESEDFLPLAVDIVTEQRKAQNRHIPFAINTGFASNIKLLSKKIENEGGRVFEKTGNPPDALFTFLTHQVENQNEYKIERDHEDVFSIFLRGYLDLHLKPELISLIYSQDDPTKIKDNLGTARRIQEATLNKVFSELGSNVGGFNGRNNFLSGNPHRLDRTPFTNHRARVYQSEAIHFLADSVYKIGSHFGNHSGSNVNNDSLPSVFCVKSITYALLEQLVWFKRFMDARP